MEGHIIRGDYEFITQLGSGSYGTVWKAMKDGKIVAIKEIPDEESGTQSPTEILISVSYSHPNIIKHLDWFFASSTHITVDDEGNFIESQSTYLVMELADTDLEKYINPNLSENTRIRLFYELISAVGFLNENNYSHCDIKPENCLIVNDTLKLADFGNIHYKGLAIPNCGTATFAPPEAIGQRDITDNYIIPDDVVYFFREQKGSNYTSDIWSLGVTFVYILTGKALFAKRLPGKYVENNLLDTLMYNMIVYIRNPEEYLTNFGIEQVYMDLFLRMLKPDVNLRVKTIDEILSYDIFKSRGYSSLIGGQVTSMILDVTNLSCSDPKINETVEWMKEILSHLNVDTTAAVIPLFYYYYNDITDMGRIEKDIKLLAITCIMLCSKIYASEYIHVNLAVELSDNQYSIEQIISMEKQLIFGLGGQLNFPTFVTLTSSVAIREKCLPILFDCGKYKAVSSNIVDFVKDLQLQEIAKEQAFLDNQLSKLESLSDKLLPKSLVELPLYYLLKLSDVSTKIHQITQDSNFWNERILKDFPNLSSSRNMDPKGRYFRLLKDLQMLEESVIGINDYEQKEELRKLQNKKDKFISEFFGGTTQLNIGFLDTKIFPILLKEIKGKGYFVVPNVQIVRVKSRFGNIVYYVRHYRNRKVYSERRITKEQVIPTINDLVNSGLLIVERLMIPIGRAKRISERLEYDGVIKYVQ